ncbi:endonuclease/exonuclease/phosphatase family protein [Medicago truncatula]|uniref:Endonuclease/exonuclease/phosphatase family protein n=1 Tax=Medicago truncatula TaxID=3880 RepID=A0A072VIL0_MEDTR|nr:endonuclease/exonuclease/phosphatase family protein [Medicago truncatula]
MAMPVSTETGVTAPSTVSTSSPMTRQKMGTFVPPFTAGVPLTISVPSYPLVRPRLDDRNTNVQNLLREQAYGMPTSMMANVHNSASAFAEQKNPFTITGGGLACLWNKNFNCSITNFSQNHIDVDVNDSLRGRWRLTGFYGMPEGGRGRESWNLLRHISNLSQLPWCIVGDFNDILATNEKKGRSDRQPWLIQGFRQAVMDAGLADIHMDDYAFTWFKSLGTDRAVEEKLDRAMANDSWFDKFQIAKLECLTTTSSDHYPLLLDCAPQPSTIGGQRRFRFCKCLGYGERPLVHKLNQCALDLSKWRKNVNQNTRQEIRKTQRKLEAIRTHVDASNLFQKSNGSRANVINLVPATITIEDNFMLTESFTLEEFKQAVFSMQADKCPGPDGFNPGFYQHFWDTCGPEVYIKQVVNG